MRKIIYSVLLLLILKSVFASSTFAQIQDPCIDRICPTSTPTPLPTDTPTSAPEPTTAPTSAPITSTPTPAPTSVPTPTKKIIKPTAPAGFVNPTIEESPTPTFEPTPTKTPAKKASRSENNADLKRMAFVKSIMSPKEIPFSAEYLVMSAFLAGLIVILILFPSELFNSTLQSNYDEIIQWFWLHKIREFFRVLNRIPSIISLLLFGILSAVINSFLSPDLGFNISTLAYVLGVFVALIIGSTVYDLVRAFYMRKRFGVRSSLRAHSFGLFTGSVLVLISRLSNFLPGYCYGLFTSLVYRNDPKDQEDGQGLAIASVMLLSVALLGWFLWVPVKAIATANNPSLPVLIADSAMSTLWVSALTATVFGLIPMRFLYGEQIKKWNKLGWGIIYSIGVFLFVYTLLNPAIGIYGKSSTVSLAAVLGLFFGFGAISILFWGYFRYRHFWRRS